ncbi:MAG: carboxypeptidase regulatory-like domain-containing protein [Ahniella sp.]|nr:carboxypeptidase regulatory-like domain-containing protein [Ahniella sp.]
MAWVLGDDTLPSTMAAGDGRFQLEDLPPGPYTLEISHPGFLTAQRSVTIGGAVVGDIGVVTLEPVSVTVFSGFVRMT